MTDMRDVCFTAIWGLMERDELVTIITVDLGAFVLDELARAYPDRIINAGISEQLAVSLAAGMSIGGKKPYIYGISGILIRRALAQITQDVGANNLNVVILGLGAGKSFRTDGISHCCENDEDEKIMQTVPNMHIDTPSDTRTMQRAVALAYERNGPTYIRFDK